MTAPTTKMTSETRKIILDKMAAGFSLTASAGAAGVSPNTVNTWAKTNVDFRRELEIAEAKRVLELETVFLDANAPAPVINARKTALINAQRRTPDEHRDWAPENAQVAVTNADGSNLNASPADLAAAMASLIAKGQVE